jgi:putative protein-disulfide isomerase
MVIPTRTIHYIADPMCSWCYGFRPTLDRIKTTFTRDFGCSVQYRLAGLAPDSDVPMPDTTREYIQTQWREVTARSGMTFNWNFWSECTPRRSTYNACRAVIAAHAMDTGSTVPMFTAIQEAYYQRALNPSDISVLVELAGDLGLNRLLFDSTLRSPETEQTLQADIAFRARVGNPQFPSLVLESDDALNGHVLISNGFVTFDEVLRSMQAVCAP